MSWTPPAQADWVRRANAGDDPDRQPAPGPFDADSLVAEAEQELGLGANNGDWAEPLAIACAALEHEAELTPLGRWATQRYLRRLVRVRLQLDALGSLATPAAEAGPTSATTEPIFVIGPPRSGTTLLHRLLAADPALRAPLGWEFLYPIADGSEPTSQDEPDPRVAAAAAELVFPQTVAQGLDAIHSYSAIMVKECLSAMAFSFRTEEFISRYHVPSYAEWLRDADLTPAYRTHRQVLETIQGQAPTRWVLKSPVHLQGIPELIATYPDATIICTHREPTEVLASVSSLIATLRSAFSDADGAEAIGRYHADLYARSLDRLVDHVDTGVLAQTKVIHLAHRHLTTDLQAALAGLYDQLGRPVPREVAVAAEAERNPDRIDRLGAHRYSAADFSLSAELASRFTRYRDRFLSDDPRQPETGV